MIERMMKIPNQGKSVKNEQKPKRGRQAAAKKALEFQPKSPVVSSLFVFHTNITRVHHKKFIYAYKKYIDELLHSPIYNLISNRVFFVTFFSTLFFFCIFEFFLFYELI